MADKDLDRFIQKVNDLKDLVDSLESTPTRKEKLTSCSNHNEVVQLARSWGYEIGSRWGERDVELSSDLVDNIFQGQAPSVGEETSRILKKGMGWRLELIVSNAFSSPSGFWLDQSENEWVVVVKGSGCLRIKDKDEIVDMSVGDHIYIPANCLHRVERTDPIPGTVWLALFWE